jgi:hypothetical protein
MILANVRASLGREDAQLALQLVGRGSRTELERAEAKLRDEGMDAVLDDPRLLAGLLEYPLGSRVTLQLFCYVVVRHALRGRGQDDRLLSDYVASILLHFTLKDRFSRISSVDDEQYDTLSALLDATDGPDASRNFLARAHLGNYALWLSGLFPDHIEQRRWRRGGPDLEYYEEMGKRGFQLAADHRLAQEHGLSSLFADVADRFGAVRMALNSVSDALLFPSCTTPERLMRQVRDEMRWRVS